MTTIRRFVHPEGWFADVPVDGSDWLDKYSTISIVPLVSQDTQVEHDGADAGFIDMRGRVVMHTTSHTVISCGGLIVSIPQTVNSDWVMVKLRRSSRQTKSSPILK